jgi:hypothetical protein
VEAGRLRPIACPAWRGLVPRRSANDLLRRPSRRRIRT